MLSWSFYFSFFIGTLCISFLSFYKSLLTVLVITELITIFMFILALNIGVLFNLYYLFGLALLLLILGGLELALAFLILVL